MNQAGLHGPHKIGRVNALHGSPDGVDLQQIAGHHLGTELFQGFCPGILLVNHRVDTKS